MIESLSQAVKFLEKYIPAPEKKHPGELGVERMKSLMGLLGNPQLNYPTIHVGGTSGKGSTTTIIASILANKYKVGLHTSPHLVKINERIKIMQRHKDTKIQRYKDEISDNQFIALLNQVYTAIERVEKSSYGKPSYFEIIAAMAFLFFKKEKVDIAVIEVGMGGRYDATNVVKPLVAVITNVGLDHTEVLGETVEEIAKDKVGIIKQGIQVVSGVRQPSVIKIVKKKCEEVEAQLSLLEIPPPQGSADLPAQAGVHPWSVFETFSYRIKKVTSKGSVFDYIGENSYKNLRLSLLGEHQVENASIALRAIEECDNVTKLQCSNEKISEEDIRRGLKSVFVPGRLEIIKRKPIIILDGAHNQDKAKALVKAIKDIFPRKKVTAIIAIKNDKNAKSILSEILEISYNVIFTKFQLTADLGVISSFNPEELLTIAKTMDNKKTMLVIDNTKDAIERAIKITDTGDLILVTGSLYLVGEIRKLLISNY